MLWGVPSGTIYFKVHVESIVSLGTTKGSARLEFNVEAEERLSMSLDVNAALGWDVNVEGGRNIASRLESCLDESASSSK